MPEHIASRSPEDFKRALDAAGAGIWDWDARSRTMALSPQSRVLLGCGAVCCLDYVDFLALAHPEDRIHLNQLLPENGFTASMDVEFRTALGGAAARWINLRGGFARDGAFTSASGVLTDVSARKQAPPENSRVAAVIPASKDAIIGKTLDGAITGCDAGAEAVLAHSEAEMRGTAISRLTPDGGTDELPQMLERMRRDAQTRQRLRDTQAELARMSRFNAMGEMASTLAHELNQPLTAVVSYLNGCRRLIDRGEKINSHLLNDGITRAAEQALRAGQIIRSLRQFVAREDGERQLENLQKLIEEASTLAFLGIAESGVHVDFQFGLDAIWVFAEKIQIEQVLLNLIRNAIEAMQESPRRELLISTTAATESMVEVRVADTGAGISAQIAAQLFKPFVTTKAKGMGIGLSISRTIIEAHGGQLWAESNPAGGTVFHMTLPSMAGKELEDDR